MLNIILSLIQIACSIVMIVCAVQILRDRKKED